MDDSDSRYLHTVFTFAVGVGVLLLGSGAAASEIVKAMLLITQKAGLDHVSADVTYAELRLSYQPENDFPYTRIQTIRGRTFNYGKLTDASRLVEQYCAGKITIEQAVVEADTIKRARGPYPWWGARLASGAAGASAALIFGGGWLVVLAAFLANVLLDWLLGVLAQHDWPSFYLQAIAGLVAVLAAVAVHLIDAHVDPSRVVVSVIIVMLAGMTSTGAVQDALTGWYVTAVGRFFEAAMNTIGLIVGIKLGMLIADRAGAGLTITANVSMASLRLPYMLLAAAAIAIGFSFLAQNPARIILPTALLSAAAYATFSGGNSAHLGTVWSTALAAFVAGFVAVFYAQWLKAPAAAFAICAILPMLPGLVLYQALSTSDQPYTDNLNFLIQALGIALALASGVSFGEYIAILTRKQLRIVENRFFTPLFATPSATQSKEQTAPES